MKQKESVYVAFMAESQGKSIAECSTVPGFRERVVEAVAASLNTNETEWDSADKSPEKCLAYASQLYSNWTKKDIRISGIKYEPATKRGPQMKDDKLIKLTTALKSASVHAPEKVPQIEALIEIRKAELTVEKSKTKVMNSDELNATLAELGLNDTVTS
jgi:hypothetical protein